MKSKSQFHVDESKPWFQPEAGWPCQVPRNIEFPRISLYEMFCQAVEKYRDLPAIWFLKQFMTYGELAAYVDRLATGLHRTGLKKGDVVAIALPNCCQYVISYYACAKLGLIPVPVNPTYKPAEVLHELKLVGAGTVIILDVLYEPLLASIESEHHIDRLIVTNIVDMLKLSSFKKWLGKKLKKIPTGKVPKQAVSFLGLLDTKPLQVNVNVGPDDIATYIMTGGTTGIPKATVLTNFNCVSNAIQVSHWLWSKEPGACMVGILPLFHSFGMTSVMNCVLHSGMFMMLFPKPPDTEETIKTICEIGPDNQTYYPGAEVLFQRIADYPEISKYPIAKKLRGCISGAGPLHKNVKDRFQEATGVLLVEGYGLSEASPVVAGGALGGGDTTGTIGFPLPGIEWKIMDMETGTRELPVGESGELTVTGPTVMQGYLGNPTETEAAIMEIDGKRWLYTGDIGFMDEHGRVTLNDRKKQLIKVKGYSVFPTEVEQLLGSHDCIHDVAVAGLPDKETGEAVKAWVVVKKGWEGRITEEELKQWAKTNITHYKVPKHIDFIQEIPKSIVGKVLRRELQESDPIYKAFYGDSQAKE
ncbi:MAG: AMP-binding protein [Desulfomonile tiedjei]|uniref:AMP-binding protein n=1 Tax=Desulfomonile tiedjei TaxID=2358 RepID=A0A9D6V6S7_9BACT|nr:AMP-binding protein [Desulfomonile tiedjei]